MGAALVPFRRRTKRLQVRVLRHFQKLSLTEQHFLIALAMVIGVSTGLLAVVYRTMLETMYDVIVLGGQQALGVGYLLPLIPAAGGLVAGLLIRFYSSEAKGPGVSEVINAMITRGSVIRPRVVLAKSLASGFTLGSGGSAGSEGPVIQIGAAWGSSLGQAFKVSEASLRTLIACGSAAGISAIFNAPIAGVLFSLEIFLFDFTVAAFTPVVIASVLSAVVAHVYLGHDPVFHVPDYQYLAASELGWYVALALIVGVVGAGFIRLLDASEDLFEDRLSWIPEWLRPAVGGALVGGIALGFPQILGVGYPITEAALDGGMAVGLLVALLGLKLVATSLSIGSGGSGGIFAPSLLCGAALGGAFGRVADMWLPGVASPPGAFALVGMGAMVAATTHAPLSAMLIIFEMTGSYHMIVPLMITTILAMVVARSIERESSYTLKLKRRGLNIHRGRDLSVLERIPVSRIVRQDYDFIREHTPMGEIANLIQHGSHHDFPVLDREKNYLGMIWFHDVREVMLENEMYPLLIAEDVLGDPPAALYAYNSLADALLHFTTADADTLPVFASVSDRQLAGVITRSDLMRCYERELLLRERGPETR